MTLVVKNPSASAGDTGSTPGSRRPLEEEMATHSSILPERNPTGWQRVGHDWAPLSVFWLHWAFSAKHGHSLVEVSGSYAGFSLRWLFTLQSTGSRRVGCSSGACWLSRCGTCGLLPRGMWALPGPGIDPMAPALAGRFLTTEPPGKLYHSCCCCLVAKLCLTLGFHS